MDLPRTPGPGPGTYSGNMHVAGDPYGTFLPNDIFIDESNVTADFLIKNNSLFWYTLYPVRGSPVYITSSPSSDAISTAEYTLDELQAFSAKEYLPTMRNMLNTVTELKSSKTTIGDFTQEIAVSGNTVRMSWEPFANGLSNPQNKLYLEFQNGHLMHYADYFGMYKTGSSEVKISEAHAIQIATERARAFSYVQDSKTVSNFTVLDSLVIANISLQNRGNNTL